MKELNRAIKNKTFVVLQYMETKLITKQISNLHNSVISNPIFKRNAYLVII